MQLWQDLWHHSHKQSWSELDADDFVAVHRQPGGGGHGHQHGEVMIGQQADILSFILRGPHNPWRLFKKLAGKLNKNDLRPMADQFGGNVTKSVGSVPQLFLAFSRFRPRFPAF